MGVCVGVCVRRAQDALGLAGVVPEVGLGGALIERREIAGLAV